MSLKITTKGFKELERAIKRNPKVVESETKKYLTRGIALYNRSIIRQPWRIGQQGGGVPVDTGNLRDTHQKEVRSFHARIYPTSPYASFVHGLNGKKKNKFGTQLRPWLDYAREKNKKGIKDLGTKLLKNVTKDLAK